MTLCYVTGTQRSSRVQEAFAAGIQYVQYRAKELPGGDLHRTAAELVKLKTRGKLLINDRMDVALACSADGVHLPANRPSVTAYRKIAPRGFLISVSCHAVEEVQRAADDGADFVLLAPIFDSPGKGPPLGLAPLEQAARLGIPVLALGGITLQNAASCRRAGAAGIAAIRLFEDAPDISAVVRELMRLA